MRLLEAADLTEEDGADGKKELLFELFLVDAELVEIEVLAVAQLVTATAIIVPRIVDSEYFIRRYKFYNWCSEVFSHWRKAPLRGAAGAT